MLELTARYADTWNVAWFGMPDERWAGLRRDLEAACRAVGRDPSTLERTVGVNVRIDELVASSDPGPGSRLSGGPEAIAAGIAAYAADGTGELIAALEPNTAEAVGQLRRRGTHREEPGRRLTRARRGDRPVAERSLRCPRSDEAQAADRSAAPARR